LRYSAPLLRRLTTYFLYKSVRILAEHFYYIGSNFLCNKKGLDKRKQ